MGQLATTSKQLTRDGPSGPWDCVGCAGVAPTPTEGIGGHIVWVATLPANETALALFNIAVRGNAETEHLPQDQCIKRSKAICCFLLLALLMA